MLQVVIYIAAMLHEGSSTTYFVKPDHSHYPSNNTHTLDHYLVNSDLYFTSHTRLQFFPGMYHLKSNFILQNVKNFTVTGIASVIDCKGLPINFKVTNVTLLTILNIEIANCGQISKLNSIYKIPGHVYDCSGMMCFKNCAAVWLTNITITPNPNTSGIVAINLFDTSFVGVKIVTNCEYSTIVYQE